MGRKRYPSDLTERQWRIFSAYIPAPKEGGRPARLERRELVNAMLYVTTQGVSWRSLPHDYPHWMTVYSYYRAWCREGIWEAANAALVQKDRVLEGRDAQPSAGALDSQTVKTTQKGGSSAAMTGARKSKAVNASS